MHFLVDKNNKVGGMHIERWDEIALGPALVKKVNSYAGKKLDDFLRFVLNNKLFLKLKIFYMMKDKGAVYFWTSAACLGAESANQLLHATQAIGLTNCKYAEVRLKLKGQNDAIIPVLIEDVLAAVYQKLGFPSEVIELEMDPVDAKEISVAFNVARNLQHLIRNRVKLGDKDMFMNMQLKGVKFVGIDKNQCLDILDDKMLKKFSRKDAEKYLAIFPTAVDEKDRAEIEKILARIQAFFGKPAAKGPEKAPAEKEPAEPKNKEVKKGFFSKLFGK